MARKNLQMASRGFNEPSCSQTNGQKQLGTRKRKKNKKRKTRTFSRRALAATEGEQLRLLRFFHRVWKPSQSLSQKTNFRLDKEKYMQTRKTKQLIQRLTYLDKKNYLLN